LRTLSGGRCGQSSGFWWQPCFRTCWDFCCTSFCASPSLPLARTADKLSRNTRDSAPGVGIRRTAKTQATRAWPLTRYREAPRRLDLCTQNPCTGDALVNTTRLRLQAMVAGSGRVPPVRLSVHGPKTDSSNAFAPSARTLAFGRSLFAI
jgi:hypothetical protein